jgi:hypothetical protein
MIRAKEETPIQFNLANRYKDRNYCKKYGGIDQIGNKR